MNRKAVGDGVHHVGAAVVDGVSTIVHSTGKAVIKGVSGVGMVRMVYERVYGV
jgi:hypothetical protein